MKTGLKIISLDEKPELYSQTIKLIEKSFHYPDHLHFEVDFALLINRQNLKNSFLLYDENEKNLIGHLGIIERNFIIQNDKFPVAFIGGICIDEKYRGQGYFNHFFKSILKIYSERVSLFFLWSDQHELYKKYSFFLGIGQVKTCEQNNQSKLRKSWELAAAYHFQKTCLANLNQEDFDKIKAIYDEELCLNYLTLERKSEHWKQLLKITSADLFIHRDQSEKIDSYFISGKGHDLENIIYEVGCSQYKKNKKQIFSILAEGQMWLPESEINFTNKSHQIFPMALVRLGNPTHFSEFIRKWSQNKINLIYQEKDSWVLKFNNENYQMNFEQIILYLFGPNPAEEFKMIGPAFFISGLDSI